MSLSSVVDFRVNRRNELFFFFSCSFCVSQLILFQLCVLILFSLCPSCLACSEAKLPFFSEEVCFHISTSCAGLPYSFQSRICLNSLKECFTVCFIWSERSPKPGSNVKSQCLVRLFWVFPSPADSIFFNCAVF